MKTIKKPNDSGYVSSLDRSTAAKLLDEEYDSDKDREALILFLLKKLVGKN